MKLTLKSAISAINQAGILLVFPIQNKKEPASLWSHFFPKTKMRWEWDDSGDSRVADLWHLREELSRSKQVVYAKWYQGRATFFSRDLFVPLLATLNRVTQDRRLPSEAKQVLEVLEMDSPLSSKVLRRRSELEGKDLESTYQKALKELWNRLRIVGFGEIDDGAFPSLAIGATQLLFEDLWRDALKRQSSPAGEFRERLASASPFLKHYDRLLTRFSTKTQ